MQLTLEAFGLADFDIRFTVPAAIALAPGQVNFHFFGVPSRVAAIAASGLAFGAQEAEESSKIEPVPVQ